ncbi:hypothetical protein AMQ83_14160 [Paenibacillus riograndensis]|nr:hypothetical protein AMQ83_14160 [Paenibacillus riograndensis]
MRKYTGRTKLMLLFLLIMALIVTACGAGGNNTNTATNTSKGNDKEGNSPAAGETGSAAGEKVTLKFTFWGSPQEKQAVERSLIHISEHTRLLCISYAVLCLKKNKAHELYHVL